MIQLKTQTREYWESDFTLKDGDFDQLYNHFLEVGSPQTTSEITRVIIAFRLAEERAELSRRLSGRIVYQPQAKYQVADALVFAALNYSYGEVVAERDGHNPELGEFKVITVEVNGKRRQFAAELKTSHVLNLGQADVQSLIETISADDIYARYGQIVEQRVVKSLQAREEFVFLGGEWLIKPLLADINIGHLHLAEAVLDMTAGGPLKTDEMIVHLDLDPGVNQRSQRFSLNYYLLHDERFDEVAPRGQVAWFLRRLEPEAVKTCAERLVYKPLVYDRALLAAPLLALERELSDEWSDLEVAVETTSVTFPVIYPHRLVGTLPLNSRLRKLLPIGRSPRQLLTFHDAQTGQALQVWVVEAFRYIYGLRDWFDANGIPVGAMLTVRATATPGEFELDYDRRRPQREDVRLATIEDNRIHFELDRRRVACGYDELMIVGTDYAAAVDGLWRRYQSQQRSLTSILVDLLPELARLSLQGAVHAKTLYSALNMVRRVPPGPMFAELIRHPAFQSVGDHYWRFDSKRWQQ